MNIRTELEKLVSLRERGELSQAESEQAKGLLLSDQPTEAANGHKEVEQDLERKRKKVKTQFLTAIFATVAALFGGVSAAIAPGPVNSVIFAMWLIASTLWWVDYAKGKAELGKCASGVGESGVLG
ncbi:MAG: SHOCT domain-containing protein [Verrucomicrobiales bacterium]|nr:SHOCT domain-containing protein [Verrucomicrobiales bacterium]